MFWHTVLVDPFYSHIVCDSSMIYIGKSIPPNQDPIEVSEAFWIHWGKPLSFCFIFKNISVDSLDVCDADCAKGWSWHWSKWSNFNSWTSRQSGEVFSFSQCQRNIQPLKFINSFIFLCKWYSWSECYFLYNNCFLISWNFFRSETWLTKLVESLLMDQSSSFH